MIYRVKYFFEQEIMKKWVSKNAIKMVGKY